MKKQQTNEDKTQTSKIKRCVFFDRDGIVNESPGARLYVTRWEDFHLIPEFTDSLRVAGKKGYGAIIITNQRCVAKGLITTEALEKIHSRLKTLLAEQDLFLLDIIYCSHEAGECSCRKPQPGMLLAMSEKHGIALNESWMIGDAETDVEAGRSAGCRTIIVGAGHTNSKADIKTESMKLLPAILESVL